MIRSRHHRRSPGPMHSQSQWRYLWATHGSEPWVRRWAEQIEAERGKKTGYHSLPGHSAHVGTIKHAVQSSRSKRSGRSHAMRKALLKRG